MDSDRVLINRCRSNICYLQSWQWRSTGSGFMFFWTRLERKLAITMLASLLTFALRQKISLQPGSLPPTGYLHLTLPQYVRPDFLQVPPNSLLPSQHQAPADILLRLGLNTKIKGATFALKLVFRTYLSSSRLCLLPNLVIHFDDAALLPVPDSLPTKPILN